MSLKAENKGHSFSGPRNDSFDGTFGQHIPLQSPRHIIDKGAPFSNTTPDLFHTGLFSMKGDNPSIQHQCNHLSSLQSEPAPGPGPMQIFDHRNRLLTVEELDIDSGVLSQSSQEISIDQPLQPIPATQFEQTYNHSSSPTTESDFNKPNERAPLIQKEDSPPSLMCSPRSPISHNMAYQNQLFHLFDNYDAHQGIQSPDSRGVPMVTRSSQPVLTRENLSQFGAVTRGSNPSSLDSTHILSQWHGSSTFNDHSPSPQILTPSDDSQLYPWYPDPGQATAIPTHTQSLPHHMLRSQPSEVSSINSWHSEPLEASAFQYSPHSVQSQDTQNWWAPSQSDSNNRPLQSHPHGNYQAIAMPGVPQQAHKSLTHTPETLRTSGLMIKMEPSSPHMSSISEPALSAPPISCPESTVTSAYTPIPYLPQSQLPQTAPLEQPIMSSHAPQMTSTPSSSIGAIPIRSAPALTKQRSPKTNHRSSPSHQRRGIHTRKSASFSGHSSKTSNRGHPINPRHHSATSSAKNIKNMSIAFENYTQKDSVKILGGVAKSGSAKTKANRDREVREEREREREKARLELERLLEERENLMMTLDNRAGRDADFVKVEIC